MYPTLGSAQLDSISIVNATSGVSRTYTSNRGDYRVIASPMTYALGKCVYAKGTVKYGYPTVYTVTDQTVKIC